MRQTVTALLIATITSLIFSWAFVELNHATTEVAFIGDSLTRRWSFPRANFGVDGQTSTQILARFAKQMPGHHVVVMLAGTNDTLLGIDQQVTFSNLSKMAELAQSEGAEPIMAEIPPIYKAGGRYLPMVRRLNEGIVKLALSKRIRVVDYYEALDGQESSFSDGTHLNQRGYLRMEWALLRTKNVFDQSTTASH
jgi:hypothetical protein